MKENNLPLVSVVIPCYNHEKYVQDSIKSIIAQSYQNIELIIIDDGSKDCSVSRIEQLVEDCKRRFVRFEFISRPNKGLSATLNEALEWCKGEYFSPLASDDIALPEKISIQVEFLQKNKNITAVFGSAYLIDDNNTYLKKLKSANCTYNFKDIILHKAVLYTPTYMTRTQLIRDVGGYNSALLIEDWYMWLKLAQLGDLQCIPEYLSLYRDHNNNISKHTSKIHEGRFQVLKLFEDSEFYDEAIKNIKWINHYDLFVYGGISKMYHLLHLFKIKPMETIKIPFKKIYLKLKNH